MNTGSFEELSSGDNEVVALLLALVHIVAIGFQTGVELATKGLLSSESAVKQARLPALFDALLKRRKLKERSAEIMAERKGKEDLSRRKRRSRFLHLLELLHHFVVNIRQERGALLGNGVKT